MKNTRLGVTEGCNVSIYNCTFSSSGNRSIEHISGLESNSRAFTITVTGLLHLEVLHMCTYKIILKENHFCNVIMVLYNNCFNCRKLSIPLYTLKMVHLMQ